MYGPTAEPSTDVAFRTREAALKVLRWSVGIVSGVLVTLWIVTAVASRTPVLRAKLIEVLSDKLEADVELDSFQATSFPSLRISGDGLRLRLKGQRAQAPLISIRHFEVAGGIVGVLHRQRRFDSVMLEGLRISIPPRSDRDREAGKEAGSAIAGPVLIRHLHSKDAELIIMPKRPEKPPRVFAIHSLDLESVGFDRSMPFHATLTNPTPTGLIDAAGTFGPWQAEDPGLTPVNGHYEFKNADLGTIKGIGGILLSTGEFAGVLEQIDVRGKTSTPDFSVDVSGQPVPLSTEFHAVVDGTDGDTYLKPVNARFFETAITANGGVYGEKGVKGRTVKLDVQIASGRIEDVLRLAVKSASPVMLGDLSLDTTLLLPPGKLEVPERLQLEGRFSIAKARFTDPEVQQKLITLSRHAQGKDDDEPLERRVLSDMKGQFTLRGGVVRFASLTFAVPGATVALSGDYNLRRELLNFEGTFSMDATVSEAAGGIKGALLKPFDPLFKKKGAGAVIPITIKGSRHKPEFAVDWRKALKRK